ncbi:hypothetical protein QUB47_10220 [Microcoleus sp. AT9_B5]
MASVFQVCDRTRLSGGDMALLLYLCGWLCGDSPGDGVPPSPVLRQKLLQFLKKATVMSLTACGTPMIHCFTHLYFF